MKDILDCSLLAHNTFGIEARCRRFLEFDTVDEARQVADILAQSDMPFIIVGEGSNLLLTRDYEGIVVHSAIRDKSMVMADASTETADDVFVSYGSGVTWDDVVAESVANGWHGAENLSLIPGEVGASAVQHRRLRSRGKGLDIRC